MVVVVAATARVVITVAVVEVVEVMVAEDGKCKQMVEEREHKWK